MDVREDTREIERSLCKAEEQERRTRQSKELPRDLTNGRRVLN